MNANSTYRSFGWPTRFPDVLAGASVSRLMKHPLFDRAKRGGDYGAAESLVDDLADHVELRRLGERRRFCRLIVVAAPDAANQIPRAFAALASRESGMQLDSGVLKANSPKHTGKSALYRFLHRASFDGTITTGANYVLLDDVMTQGGPVSELRQWLQRQGSRVAEVATLAFTDSSVMSNGRRLAPETLTLRALGAKHGTEAVGALLSDFGVYSGNVAALTESEARMILKYPSLDALRQACHDELGLTCARQEPDDITPDAAVMPALPRERIREVGRRVLV